jgi:glycosyltransferase involved in cell wall biosynthesis
MKLSLIITTYNQPEALAKVFRGLKRQTSLPDEILIADDGSAETTRELVEQWCDELPGRVHHVWHEHRGFRRAAIANKAAAASTGEYLVFLDGDCVPHEQFIGDHRALVERGCWVQARRCYVRREFVPEFSLEKTPILEWMLKGRIAFSSKALRLPIPFIRRDQTQHAVMGCNMGIWRNDFLTVNGFDEAYLGWGCEDKDLAFRLYYLGRHKKLVKHQAIIFHLDHPLASREQLDANYERYQETIRSKKIRCELGVNQYLVPASNPPRLVRPCVLSDERWPDSVAVFSKLST